MKIVSILAHPRQNSFCHAVSTAANRALIKAGHTVSFHDLYAEAFDPILKPDEAYTVGDEIEEAVARARDPVILRHRQDMAAAEGLVVVHPNWWGKPPAILCGWLDRILVPGVAYRLSSASGLPEGLLSIGKAVIINTSDTLEDRERTEMGDPLGLIWGNCVLPFCGVDSLQRLVLRPVSDSDLETRQKWLSDVDAAVTEAFG